MTSKSEYPYILSVSYGNISKISKSPLEIICKDSRSLLFDFGENSESLKSSFFERLKSLAYGKVENLFCFQNLQKEERNSENWHIYNAKSEFERQTKPLGDKCEWTLSSANQNFEICETYPRFLGVPRKFGDLAKVAEYRTRRRLPVLSWIHPETGAALLRSSQPCVGTLPEKKSSDDYIYLKERYNTI